MKRIGVIAIIIEEDRRSAAEVNAVLSEYSECIIVRTGVPNHAEDLNIISLIVKATNEEVGAITGRLGKLSGVSVKSMMTSKSY